MHNFFWLIYKQPLGRIVLCMILMAALWGYLGKRENGRLRWRIGNALAAAGMVLVIFYMTVYTRGESAEEAVFIPFQSFSDAKAQPELYRSMLMNVFLFFPVGLTLPFALARWKFPALITVAVAFFLSTGVEYLQYRYALGRCEVDDVIMNTLGAFVGCSSYWICHKWK